MMDFKSFATPKPLFAPFIAQDADRTYDPKFVGEGRAAAKAGKSRQDNPYKEGSNAAWAWAQGYTEGREKGAQDATYFQKGDTVRARESVQGMTKGASYKITDIHEQHTAFGNFVTYVLDDKLKIGNGHFVLDKA